MNWGASPKVLSTPASQPTKTATGPDGTIWFVEELGDRVGTITPSRIYITEVNQHAAATEAAPGFQVRQDFADSFLFSPVFNFPNDYNGPPNKLASDTGGALSAPELVNCPGVLE